MIDKIVYHTKLSTRKNNLKCNLKVLLTGTLNTNKITTFSTKHFATQSTMMPPEDHIKLLRTISTIFNVFVTFPWYHSLFYIWKRKRKIPGKGGNQKNKDLKSKKLTK